MYHNLLNHVSSEGHLISLILGLVFFFCLINDAETNIFAYTFLPICVILSQGKFLEWDCQMRGWVHVLLSSSFLRALLEEVLKFFLLRLN